MTDGGFTRSEMMIVAAARELAGQHVCFVGVGLPNIAVNLAKRTVAPDLELVYEAGVFGARPSCIGRAADDAGPASHRARSPWRTIANAGSMSNQSSNPRTSR